MDHGKHGKHGNLLFEEESFRARNAVFEVSRELGTGFLEAVYHEALALEFQDQQIPYVATPTLGVTYKGVFSVFSVAKSSVASGSR